MRIDWIVREQIGLNHSWYCESRELSLEIVEEKAVMYGLHMLNL